MKPPSGASARSACSIPKAVLPKYVAAFASEHLDVPGESEAGIHGGQGKPMTAGLHETGMEVTGDGCAEGEVAFGGEMVARSFV